MCTGAARNQQDPPGGATDEGCFVAESSQRAVAAAVGSERMGSKRIATVRASAWGCVGLSLGTRDGCQGGRSNERQGASAPQWIAPILFLSLTVHEPQHHASITTLCIVGCVAMTGMGQRSGFAIYVNTAGVVVMET